MEDRSRLVVFGCSQTYGHCLPDCYIPDSTHYDGVAIADNPSRFAFPQIVADKINRQCVNRSYPGSSVKFSWYESVNFEYLSTDIVIFVWTLPNRSMVIDKNNQIDHIGCWPSLDKLNKVYQYFVGVGNSDNNLEIEAWHHMDHANRVVVPQVQRVLNYCLVSANYENCPKWATFDFIEGFDRVVKPPELDFALDNSHYGLRSHRVIAKRIMRDLAIDSSLDV